MELEKKCLLLQQQVHEMEVSSKYNPFAINYDRQDLIRNYLNIQQMISFSSSIMKSHYITDFLGRLWYDMDGR